jgi:hypothetical protein
MRYQAWSRGVDGMSLSSVLGSVDRRLVLFVVALAVLAVGVALAVSSGYLGAGGSSGPALGATMVEYALL